MILNSLPWLLMSWQMLLILHSLMTGYSRSQATFKVTEGLACVKWRPRKRIGKIEVEKTLIQYKLKWNLPWCVTDDSGKNMCTAEKCSVGKIYKVLWTHKVVHQQLFCRKFVNLQWVIETVMSTVDFIFFQGLNNCWSHELLLEIESRHLDLSNYTAVQSLTVKFYCHFFFSNLGTRLIFFLNE